MNEKVRDILRRLRDGLATLYGERLKGAYLFGSCARGEADDESDIHVLILLDRVENDSHEIGRTCELVAKLSLECGRSISRVFVSEERWRNDQTMFLLNVREEATPV